MRISDWSSDVCSSDLGARLYPGRWNTAASPIIYTSEHYSTAMLENLVHANTVMPANQHYISITIPNGVSYEVFPTAKFSGWDGKREDICKTFSSEERRVGKECVSTYRYRCDQFLQHILNTINMIRH